MKHNQYRGKRVDTGEWVYGYLSSKNTIRELDWEHKVILKTVGQYIGLNDRENDYIYEGDIVEYSNIINKIDLKNRENDYSEITTRSIGVVEYSNRGCFWLNGLISIHCQYKKIGNIFDNPELLHFIIDKKKTLFNR